MDKRGELIERFEAERARLWAVAYRMLGSRAEADDAVQEAWLRLSGTDAAAIENLGGWLTTTVARVCLNLLRARRTRREDPLDLVMPDPIIERADGGDPEGEAILADAIGMALLVILDTLTPAERIAFVLHDGFAVPFDQIAPLLDRTPAATRQLASRARRRVREEAPTPDPDLGRQRAAVDAYFAAARDGDFDALVAVLDPDVILRADGGGATARPTLVLRGPHAVAEQARNGARWSTLVHPALINGTAGAVVIAGGRALSVMAFTVSHGKIAAIDVLYDPRRLEGLDVSAAEQSPDIDT